MPPSVPARPGNSQKPADAAKKIDDALDQDGLTRSLKSMADEPAEEMPAEETAAEVKPVEAEPVADETPVAEEPVVDKAPDEPGAEEPATEEPAEDKPVAEDKPAAEEPAAEEQPAEEPDAIEPAEEKPVEEPTAPEEAPAKPTTAKVVEVDIEPDGVIKVDVTGEPPKATPGGVFDVDVATPSVSEPRAGAVFDVDVAASEFEPVPEEEQVGELTDRILALGEGSMEEDMVIGAPSQRKPFRFFRRRGTEPPEQTLMATDEIPEPITEEVKVTNDHEDDLTADTEAEEPNASVDDAEEAEAAEAEAEDEAPAAKPSRRPVKRVTKDDDEASPKSKSKKDADDDDEFEETSSRPVRRSVTQAPVKKARPTRRRDDTVQVSGTRTTPFMFIRQAVGELRKVVWPSGEQVGQYFVVVLVFVLFLMLVVAGLDYLFGQALLALFK